MLLKEGVSSVHLCGIWIIWRYILNFRTNTSVQCWKHYSYFSGYCQCYYHYYHHRCAVSLRIQVCYAFVLVIFSPNLQDLLGERPVCGNSFLWKYFWRSTLHSLFWKSNSPHLHQISLICQLAIQLISFRL